MAKNDGEGRAFGWPAGSVRALVTFMVVWPTVMVLAYLASGGDSVALTAMVGMAFGATGYYFGKGKTPA